MNKICKWCKIIFIPRIKHNQVYCSVKCRDKHEYHLQRTTPKKLNHVREYARNYYQKNILQMRKTGILWRKNNPNYMQKMRNYAKMWYLKNRDKRRKQIHNYYMKIKHIRQKQLNHKRKTNFFFAKNQNFRDAFRKKLKLYGHEKDMPFYKSVNYSFRDLTKHLELQFTPEMNWGNYSTYWEIDHIIPMRWFKTKTQFIEKGWALKNLQPLEKEYNRSKNSHYAGNPRPRYPTIYL